MPTEKTDWLRIDGDMGERFIPTKEAGLSYGKNRLELMNESGAFPKEVMDLYEGLEVHEVEVVKGYGVEIPGSGYMEMPEWRVFTRKDWAEQAAAAMESY